MRIEKLAAALFIALLMLGIFLLAVVNAQEPSGEVGVYWNDPAVITGPLHIEASVPSTITQYIDFQVRSLTGTVIASDSVLIDAGETVPGAGIAASALYDFDLQPGEYELWVRNRVDVNAEYVGYSYGSATPVETSLRRFYGFFVEGSQIVPNDALGYAYVADIIVFEFENIYLPIIVKRET